MKKLFFLTALLCASMMGWADEWTGQVSGVATNVWTTGEAHGEVNYSINYMAVYSSASEQLTITFEITGDILSTEAYEKGTLSSPNMYIRSTNTFYSVTNNTCIISGAREIGEVVTVEFHVVYNAGEFYKEFSYTIPDDGSGSLPSSDLSLDITEKTLNADESETHQIEPETVNGYDGIITYASSNDNIATVSSSGLVTAIGKGVVTITVTAPATASYQKSTQTLTVTVTSSHVNWEALSWVENSNEKFKVAAAEGQSVVNVQKPGFAEEDGIYTTFPVGISACSLPVGKYAIQGGGIVLYLSAFTKKLTNVIVTAGQDYEFTVFYADGEDTTTAITNTEVEAKAVKMIENGQLVIIKNGVKYNAIGTQIK